MFELRRKYKEELVSKLKEELQITNAMLVPRLEKIVISVGAGDYAKDSKIMQNIADTISLIAGQKAIITKAKKSVAGFKMREGMPMGVKVTLRGNEAKVLHQNTINDANPGSTTFYYRLYY